MTRDLVGLLCSTELFHMIDMEPARELAAEMEIREFRKGEILVRQGEPDQNLYLVISGTVQVISRDSRNEPRLLFEAFAGESAGEMALVADDLALATLQAATEGRAAVLPRTVFERFAARHPHDALQMIDTVSRRLKKYSLSAALHLRGLFNSLNTEALRGIESELEMFMLYGGEVLFRPGEPGDSMFVVISGRLRATGGDEPVVAEVGAGEIIGEMEMLSGKTRTTTVTAMRDTQLARLPKPAFERFAERYPEPAMRLVSRIAVEGSRNRQARRDISTIAVIPAHGGAPTLEFCEALSEALKPFGTTLHLTSARVDSHLGREGIAQTFERDGANIRLVEWLSNHEMTHDFVLYEADAYLSPWTERCIRQSDHVLIVGDGKGDPAPGDIEKDLLQSGDKLYARRQWLALVHREGDPSGTARWLEPREVERYYHVRLGDSRGFERLARMLTGRAIGLTLGGGFARGLAHLGVFRAFTDLGVAVDAVGGASMGAMVGALWAMGKDLPTIMEDTKAVCAGAFEDLTFPFIAFKTGKKYSEGIRKLFGDTCIEDLWMPYFCISANLNRAELMVHTRGPLAKAILAATRAPGVFPPIVYDGELHVDGGVINNVPVDIMKTFLNDGITAGVDVSPPHELNEVGDYGDDVSGLRALWKRFRPFSKNRIYTPSILLVMIRTLEFSGVSYRNLRIKLADLYMSPAMLQFKRTDFHLANEIAQAGYDCANENLLEWLASTDGSCMRRPDLYEVRAAVGAGTTSR